MDHEFVSGVSLNQCGKRDGAVGGEALRLSPKLYPQKSLTTLHRSQPPQQLVALWVLYVENALKPHLLKPLVLTKRYEELQRPPR